MAIARRRPQNPSLRFQTYLTNEDVTTSTPHKSLVVGLRKSGGRNAYGRITVRHIGGGAQRKYRIIDFARTQKDVPGKVTTIEYDPNRNVRIGLVVYANGAKHYMLLPEGLKVNTTVLASAQAEARLGNSLPLSAIPVGFMVHNIEMTPGSGGKLARSAGASAQIMSKTEDGYATLKMPSGEIRMVPLACWATVGVLGNAEHRNITWGKAGRSRNRGIRPSVRGMAMNPVDHPHGGGEGRSKSGSHPQSPWGKGAKGTRTRTRKNRLIVKRRK
ncbi:50S ribosomal protein L2 [Vermiphilus pyriformis]|jgi:large subunit ribosomal protein L2|nr:MAG: 50S ribosomal protein L2 [Vermiphilus pyriformis]